MMWMNVLSSSGEVFVLLLKIKERYLWKKL